VTECRQVLGSELHYQAMVYSSLRNQGQVPAQQVGMNVKMWISNLVSDLFKTLDARKREGFQGGFEPIPDVCLFSPGIEGDWRRRNNRATLRHLLLAIEVKASERSGGRLSAREIVFDIEKLAAHRQEAQARGSTFHPVMMVIDTAPLLAERMMGASLKQAQDAARELSVSLLYLSPSETLEAVLG